MTMQEVIARINELARKAKTPEGLTEAEAAERAVLRRAYIDRIKRGEPTGWARGVFIWRDGEIIND